MEDNSNYEKLREDALRYYNEINHVYSPLLQDNIRFSAEGFNHIIFRRARTERDRSSQIMRMKLLPLAKNLVEVATTYQEFEETLQEFEVKHFKKRVVTTKPVYYWGLIAIIDGRKIKVIIRKVGENGTLHFWSIVPAWMTNKYRDTRFVATMKGNPEED